MRSASGDCFNFPPHLDFWIAKSVVQLVRGVAVAQQVDEGLSSVNTFGGGDVTVASELHPGEVHAHRRQLVHVKLLGFGEAQNVESFLQDTVTATSVQWCRGLYLCTEAKTQISKNQRNSDNLPKLRSLKLSGIFIT